MNTKDCHPSDCRASAQRAQSGHPPGPALLRWLSACAMALGVAAMALPTARATTALADQPVFSNISVPGNLALALSVEFPTAVSVAHTDATYNTSSTYLGYFDPAKCYLYSYSATEAQRHFYPAGAATNRTCIGGNDLKWSGNYLNWATMQTVDPFRWALTGGYRVTDSATVTIIEKAHASGQGGTGNFPNRTDSSAANIANTTPFAWSAFKMRVQGLGNKMSFSQSGNIDNTATPYNPDPAVVISTSTVYEVSVRVKVCDTSAAAGGLEANCTAYPAGNYKPTGLLQQYANNLRYSAFGYLNDNSILRDGGVLRAKQKFVGPTRPVPSSTPVPNGAAEWDSNTGILVPNPDDTDASATAALFGVPVGNSGVINYLNKFGQITPSSNSYKTYDPVSELYYAAIRYFKNLGNVPEWTNMTGASTATKTTWVDGFPVITTWDDPIQYSCQRNFVLGIGDVNTHADKNLPGSTPTGNEPAKPAAVTADTSVNAVTATNKVGMLHGNGLGSTLGSTNPFGGCCNNNSALMAGLAYDSNARDIRPDDPAVAKTKDKQTVQTLWLDILEYQTYKANNQFYLASKYGGAKLPEVFDPYGQATDLPASWWTTTGETVGTGATTQPRPDNYFVASKPDQMVSGLTRAFAKIFNDLRAYTTSFATALPQTALTGTSSFGAKFDSTTWTGEVEASSVSFDASTGAPTFVSQWSFSTKLATQIAGTGWNTNRRMVTFKTDSRTGVPFRLASISATQQTALDTIYRGGNDSSDYLNYLRGDPTHEENSVAAGSANIYRNRGQAVGDISGSKVRPVGPPSAPFSSAANPGYSTFKSDYAGRKTMVYVGTNAGVLHAIDGHPTSATFGQEVFAYVPGALYQGPTGSPITDGLMSRGDPNFTHKALVDGSAVAFDIDLGRTFSGRAALLPATWRTVLVGSLGKGGKSYFALDVTDPSAIDMTAGNASTAESTLASKVMWEFSDANLGFTYGVPTAVKTRQYGWVLIFGSGYNNADGVGYFFIVDPRSGLLLQTVSTGVGSPSNQAGLAHVQGFILDRTDGTADAVYAGDLLGNVWRLDVTALTGSYPAPVRLAQLTNASNAAVPITVRPLVIVHPRLNVRYVTVGSGKLLDVPDIGSAQEQVFAAIMDGNGNAFGGTLPAGVSYPIQRSNLVQQTDLTRNVTIPNTHVGWWLDLGVTAGRGWRVITDATSFSGKVTFAAMQPSADVCKPAGISRLYSVDVDSGQSELAASVAFLDYADQVIQVQNFSVNGVRRVYSGDVQGRVRTPNLLPIAPPGLRRLNWRELPLAD